MCEPKTKGGGRTGGRSGDQGDGSNEGQGGQQLQNLLPTIVAQVGGQGRGQGNGKNQNGDAVNDNIRGDVGNVFESNDRRGCTYKEFLACNPNEDSQKVKYTVSLFVGKDITWWNSQIHTRGRESIVGMSWEDFKTLTRKGLGPSNEMQNLETELWNHAMVEAGHAAYTDRFHELARLVPHLVTPKGKRIERESGKGRAFMLGAEEARQDPNIVTAVGESVAASEICCRRQKHRCGTQNAAATAVEHLVLPEDLLLINVESVAQSAYTLSEARKSGSLNNVESSDFKSPPARQRNQYTSVIQDLNSPDREQLSLEMRGRTSSQNINLRSFCPVSVVLLNIKQSGDNSVTRRRMRRRHVAPVSEKDEDAALAMRLQGENFIGAYEGSQQPQEVQQQRGRSYVTTAMVNMRAMASRAVKWHISLRYQQVLGNEHFKYRGEIYKDHVFFKDQMVRSPPFISLSSNDSN
nr:reverse transcriptase domain-containing protein [Tanacetum cinerariifolium]